MRLGLCYDLRNPGAARPWARVYATALDRDLMEPYLAGLPDADRLQVCTPAAAAAYVTGLCAGLPVTDVFCFADIGGLDDELVDRHFELAVHELAPLLAEEGDL